MNYNFCKILLLILFCCGYTGCLENQLTTQETQSTIVEEGNSSWSVETVQTSKIDSLVSEAINYRSLDRTYWT